MPNPNRAEQDELVLRLRAEGLTFKDIGAKIERSVERVRQIYYRAQRIQTHLARHPEHDIRDARFSARTTSALTRNSVNTLAQLRAISEDQIRAIPDIGDKALCEIKRYLSSSTENAVQDANADVAGIR